VFADCLESPRSVATAKQSPGLLWKPTWLRWAGRQPDGRLRPRSFIVAFADDEMKLNVAQSATKAHVAATVTPGRAYTTRISSR
jgi:hypothetical protein